MNKITIYHHARCGRSRQTLALLRENGIEPEIIEYVKTPPSFDEIVNVLKRLNIPAEKLVRKNEAIFKENYSGKELSEKQYIQAMVDDPILIERPIVIKDNKAVIGRPPENINLLL
ncbi:arsenate reductase (glutaredoxin) [Peijinzhouia sedimentorum]